MRNPFESLEVRLSNIESLILDLKHQAKETSTTLPKEQFLNVQETANFLKLSVPTIYSKVSKGELPVFKRSKRLYFTLSELTDYLKTGRKKTNAEIDLEANTYLSNNKKGLL